MLNIPTRFFVVGLDGSPPREVLRDIVAKSFNRPSVAWHPDGRLSVSLNGFAPTRWVHVALGHAHAPGPFFSTVSLDGRSRTDSAVSPAVLEGIKSAGLQNWGQDMQLAWSPAGDALYHVAWSNHVQNLWKIDVDPSTLRWIGGPHRLTAGKGPDSDPVISPDGAKAAFTAELHTRRIWSFPLDPATGRLSGPGAPVTAPELDAVNADLSRDGKTLVFEAERTGAQGHRHEVWAKSLDNGRERLLRTHDLDRPDQPNVSTPRVSPDGRLVGYSRYGPSFQSLIYDSATGEERPLTQADQPGTEWLWGWSADGQWLVATGTKHTAPAWGIWLLPLSGAPRAERHLRTVTTSTDYSLWQAGLSPEGRWVSFEAVPRDPSTATLFAVPASGGPWVQLSEGRFWDDKPRWSSDGRFLYFVSSRDGLLDVWAMRFDSDRGRPGDPFRVTRFDDPRTMIFPAVGAMEIAVARHRLVVPVLEVAGSIWMLDNVDR